MTSRDFCYWLQGFFELTNAGKHPTDSSLTSTQGDMIQRHLALVFKHEIDPSAGSPEHQEKLNAIHDAKADYEKLKQEVELLKNRPPPSPGHPDGIKFRC